MTSAKQLLEKERDTDKVSIARDAHQQAKELIRDKLDGATARLEETCERQR